MIHRLRGQLVEKDVEGVVVDVGGVGYRASASSNTLRALPPTGEECVLHIRMVVREDAMLLFGFADREERAAFDSLTAVSKIGPKLALSILSALSPQEVAEAVGRGDVVKLASVPGLGMKTAERLVLELRGKNLAAFDPGINGGNAGGPYVEAREALTALGYSLEEAESALKEVPPQDSVQRYVKEALRRIGGSRRR
jgi:holliday junction DNA helicase RuvA